ncbi:MAG: hypothetical protein EOO91_03800 [Pedobacter sp.]|nr:MAG: hypothetical protein EOO91_03800 [Pedobacter sp.]
MEGDKKSPLDQFLGILEQQHKNSIQNVNKDLYNEILNAAKMIEEDKDESNLKRIINNLRERFKNENLNQVTDIFIYCQSFLSSNEDHLPMSSQLCISVGKLFNSENLHYTASKVYSQDELESGCALSFLGYLAMHDHHTPYVLSFIKENFEGFSQNKKTECVFQLKEILPDNEMAKQIVKESDITKHELIFSTETDSTSKPIKFQIENKPQTIAQEPKSKLPWWKFWSKDN